jgi:hypothetical protein
VGGRGGRGNTSQDLKKWAAVLVVLYGLVLVALTIPALAFFTFPEPEFRLALDLYREHAYWAVIALMMFGQAVMLIAPVRAAGHKSVPRAAVIAPVIVSGFLMAVLLIAIAGALYEFLTNSLPESGAVGVGVIACGLSFWIGWTIAFWVLSRKGDPLSTVMGQARWLRRTSLLAFLIAVPTHVVVRNRDNCCGGVGTFPAVACGLAILVFSFGPGVLLLYFARWKRIAPDREGRDRR